MISAASLLPAMPGTAISIVEGCTLVHSSKVRERNIDATVFRCAGLQGARRGRDESCGPGKLRSKGLPCGPITAAAARRRPARRATAVGQLLTDHQLFDLCDAIEIGAGDDHRMAVAGAGYGIREGNCQHALPQLANSILGASAGKACPSLATTTTFAP